MDGYVNDTLSYCTSVFDEPHEDLRSYGGSMKYITSHIASDKIPRLGYKSWAVLTK